jgi:serine/threonine-protein kinase
MNIFNKVKAFFQTDKVDISERFETMREAVSGTMSNFYLAKDRTTGKLVGLKIGDREKVGAFEARFVGLKKPPEGEIAMGMKHPLIVETYEYGLTTKGLRYIVMEYVHGSGMQMLLHNRDPILVGKRVKLIRQMAEAIDYVHKSGYIHRDICPRNFICAVDAESLKLIDFGLTLPAKKEFMQPGNRTGTPLYMAPEVVRRRWTDQRLDIFSLGVTAYQLCTYELPWPSADATGKAALAHDTQPPTDILELRPTLNKTLAKAIMQCMAVDPDKRPQSAEELLKMIRNVKNDDER